MIPPRKPRILYVLHRPFGPYGTEMHSQALFDGLRDRYDTWTVFPAEARLGLTRDGRAVSWFPGASVENFLIPPYSLPVTSQSLQTILSTASPDLIHIQHFLGWPLDLMDQCVATGHPVVVSIHDYYAISPAFTLRGVADARQATSPAYAVAQFGEDISPALIERQQRLRHSLSRAACIVVPSNYVAETLSRVYDLRYLVIPHGIAAFPRIPRPASSRAVAFGYLGNLIAQKGWETLVEAYGRLRNTHPDATLHLFGGANSPPVLPQGAVYHGAYRPADLPAILAMVDVVVIPSVFRETFCLVLSEAWMAGRPVVAADIGALGERVQEGANGRKFTPGDADSLCEAMAWFQQTEAWRTWTIPQPKTMPAMLDDYDRLYLELLKRSPVTPAVKLGRVFPRQ
jgi:glycosyltransferase involved in cell wall biosynthesis